MLARERLPSAIPWAEGGWLSRPCQSITAMRTSRAAAEHVTSESLDIWQRKMKGPSFGGPTDAMIQRTGRHRRRVPDARAATVPAPTSPRAPATARVCIAASRS
jgi:hypothetical protein